MALAISQRPTDVRITLRKGSTFLYSGVLSQSDSPLNISGFDFRLKIRGVADSSETIVEWSVSSGHITLNAGSGQYIVRVEAEETALLPTIQGAFYDFEIEWPDGIVRCAHSGLFDALAEATR
jgi:hypothetical protein